MRPTPWPAEGRHVGEWQDLLLGHLQLLHEVRTHRFQGAGGLQAAVADPLKAVRQNMLHQGPGAWVGPLSTISATVWTLRRWASGTRTVRMKVWKFTKRLRALQQPLISPSATLKAAIRWRAPRRWLRGDWRSH